MSNNKVLVLLGGSSGEREVSVRSGQAVAAALYSAGYTVVTADTTDAGFDLARLAKDCDAVLPIIHGAGGEDGVLQRQFEALHVPFLGSGSAACALTFDKQKYREFVTKHDVRMAEGQVVTRAEFENSALRQKPYVLKPIDGGSTVDTLILRDLASEPDGTYFDQLFTKYDRMLLEQLIDGQELTVGVLGDKALPVILIVPPVGGEFDYANKYNGQSQEIVNPPSVDVATQKQAQELALRIHHLTGCRHLSRTDMIVTEDGTLYVLETNTIPGMTEQSLLPKAAAAAGYDMPALVKRFVQMAKDDTITLERGTRAISSVG